MAWVVERAKKCLDFTATCYIWHIVFCAVHSGFPRTLTWWGVNFAGFIATALAGEWLCVRRELQDIPLVSRISANPVRKGSGMPAMPVPTEDPDGGPVRPRIRSSVLMQQRPAAAAAAAVQMGALGAGPGPGGGGGGGGGAAGGGREATGGGLPAGPRAPAAAAVAQRQPGARPASAGLGPAVVANEMV
ncbi:hypothetical protein Rsub_13421 [Raphidocelis subcapitata]|uniref:Uncharacterized protein n=1 Tax=Raphidocelis subcapitata TaxID=307507 RepID=A0A2V0PLH8_9CHLO|nr:hypothetical protein Rsub_13421 [Raphidocelis subcapitata]|eukprot:GBG00659.1 hypothetical protein Rsub_13421 [Raphidocelis subcapitata]